MSKYEIMTIYKIDPGEKGAKDLSKQVQEILTSMGGKILTTDFWGKRKFAYEINHDREGYYEVATFEAELSDISKMKKKLNLVNNLVRYLITAQG